MNRLTLHSLFSGLAWCMCGVFSTAYLLRNGVLPAQIFLAWSAILVLRLMLRPIVLFVVPRFGLRVAFVLGTFLFGFQFMFLPMVQGVGIGLALFCLATALSQVIYYTCYHVFYASLGDIDHRGSQIGARQAVSALAVVLGPLAGGLSLTLLGPWPAFGAAFMYKWLRSYRCFMLPSQRLNRTRRGNAYSEAKIGFRLFFADGWIQMSSATAWSILMFQALGERYDESRRLAFSSGAGRRFGGMILAASWIWVMQGASC